MSASIWGHFYWYTWRVYCMSNYTFVSVFSSLNSWEKNINLCGLVAASDPFQITRDHLSHCFYKNIDDSSCKKNKSSFSKNIHNTTSVSVSIFQLNQMWMLWLINQTFTNENNHYIDNWWHIYSCLLTFVISILQTSALSECMWVYFPLQL